MGTHELKTHLEQYAAVDRLDKTHEVRRNDRDFQKGDVLVLREFDQHRTEYTGRWVAVAVTHVTEGGSFGLPADLCVMSIRKLNAGRS